jgi:hypothetical protein
MITQTIYGANTLEAVQITLLDSNVIHNTILANIPYSNVQSFVAFLIAMEGLGLGNYSWNIETENHTMFPKIPVFVTDPVAWWRSQFITQIYNDNIASKTTQGYNANSATSKRTHQASFVVYKPQKFVSRQISFVQNGMQHIDAEYHNGILTVKHNQPKEHQNTIDYKMKGNYINPNFLMILGNTTWEPCKKQIFIEHISHLEHLCLNNINNSVSFANTQPTETAKSGVLAGLPILQPWFA